MLTDLQEQVINGLRAGDKLFEVLSVAGMPAKAVVDEWLLDDYFKSVYDRAVEVGKNKRQRRAEKGKGPRFRPEVVYASNAKQEKVGQDEPQGEELQTEETEPQVTPAPQPVSPAPVTALPPTRPAARKAAHNTDIALQTLTLAKLREGMPPAEVLTSIKGMSSARLTAWRKDPTFKVKWEHAKDAGQRARKAEQARLTAEQQSDTNPVAPPPIVAPILPAAPVAEVAPSLTMPGMNVACCARCGGEHTDLPVTQFTNPVEYRGTVLATAFAMCPASQEPILITVL